MIYFIGHIEIVLGDSTCSAQAAIMSWLMHYCIAKCMQFVLWIRISVMVGAELSMNIRIHFFLIRWLSNFFVKAMQLVLRSGSNFSLKGLVI